MRQRLLLENGVDALLLENGDVLRLEEEFVDRPRVVTGPFPFPKITPAYPVTAEAGDIVIALSGVAATAVIGTLATILSLGLSGVEGTGATGTITANTPVTAALTGVGGAGAIGTLGALGAGGQTYYVATTGSDANPGTDALPWLTIQHAVDSVSAGDTINVLPGTYAPANTFAVAYITTSGTSGNPITLRGSGGIPVVSGANLTHASFRAALYVSGDWWVFEDLDATGVLQSDAVSQAYGVQLTDADNNIVRRVRSYGNQGPGFMIGNGGHAVNNTILNCDAYDNYDSVSTVPGGGADGFALSGPSGTATGNVFEGCRSWNNSDDGFDLWEMEHAVTLRRNWAFLNGYDQGNGAGFKLGRNDNGPRHLVHHNVALSNLAEGFTSNSASGTIEFLHNTSYGNAYGFVLTLAKDAITPVVFYLRNNVAGANTTSPYAGSSSSGSDNTFNSWNLSVTVTAADFASLDTTLASAARTADGSLPASFARLATGSDLIDQGTNIGLAYRGAAPDLGAFEFEGAVDRPRIVRSPFPFPKTRPAFPISVPTAALIGQTAAGAVGTLGGGVAYITSVSGQSLSVTTLTLPNVAAGTGNLVHVLISWRNTSQSVTGVTFAGSAMTKHGATLTTNGASVENWYLANQSGTADVVITWGVAPTSGQATAIVYSGANPITPFGTIVESSSSGATSTSDAVTVPASGFVDDVLGLRQSGVITIGADQTLRGSQEFGTSMSHRASTQPGAAGGAMSWDWTGIGSTTYVHRAVPILASAGGMSLDVGLSGVSAIGGQGTIIAGTDAVAALTGVSGTGSPGTLTPASSAALSGVAGTGLLRELQVQGAVIVVDRPHRVDGPIPFLPSGMFQFRSKLPPVLPASSRLIGHQVTGATGTLTPGVTVSAIGIVGTGARGQLGIGQGLSGVTVQGSINSLATRSITVGLSGVGASGAIGTIGAISGSGAALTGVAATPGVGAVASPAIVEVRLSGVDTEAGVNGFTISGPPLPFLAPPDVVIDIRPRVGYIDVRATAQLIEVQ